MNYLINISPLTKVQQRNLSKGKGVRVYSGNSPIEVDKKQFTRFNRNMRLGKAFTLKLTAKQGKGIFGDAYRYIKQNPALRGMANRAISSGKAAAHYGINKATDYAHRGINRGSEYAHGKVRDFPLISGSGIRKRGRKGKGLVSDVLQGSAQLANWIDPNSHDSREAQKWLGGLGGIAGSFGLGMKPRKTRARRGKGLFGTALKGGAELSGLIGGPGSGEAKQILGGIGDVANFLGLGMKPRKKRASPAQSKALALGRAIRDANRGKVGSGPYKKTYRGSALLPAGY
jgi:hypothetical protein